MASVRENRPYDDLIVEDDSAEKHRLANRVARTEAAAKTFRRELSEAEAAHRAAEAAISTAASGVVAAVIESATDELRELRRLL